MISRLLTLHHLPYFFVSIMHAGILHAVRCNDKKSLLRNILISCILMYISYVMDSSTNRIQKCCAAAYIVLSICHRLDLLDWHSVIKNLHLIIKEHCGKISLAFFLLLLFYHRIETTNSIGFKPSHRTTSIKNKYNFC